MPQMTHIFRTLRYRNYRLFFTGQMVSLTGTWIQQVAMAWLVYRLTNSPFLLGVVGFSTQIPAFAVAPFSGVWADRFDRRRLLILTQALSMLQAAVLAYLAYSHMLQIWHVIVLGLFLGCVNAVDIPVRHSFIIEMVEKKEHLGNAIALNSLMFNVAKLIGPSIAGFLVAFVGEAHCFLINALSYGAVIASLVIMRVPSRSPKPDSGSLWGSVREGFSYAWRFQAVRTILMLLAVVSFVGLPYAVLMPVVAKDVLNGGSHTLGFLVGAAGVGALIGTVYLAGKRQSVRLGRTIPFSTIVFGCGLILFAFSRTLWLSLSILVVTGFGIMVQMAASNTVIQTIVDDDKRGRVMSIYTLAFMGTVPLGNLLIGWCATHVGVPVTLLCSGIVCLVSAVFFLTTIPSLRNDVYWRYSESGAAAHQTAS